MLSFYVSFVCYISILLLAIYDAQTYWTNGGRNHVSLKGEMTGIGILGTFIGIFIGLLDFNVNDIPASIPPLLEGLKTAFGTSIAGLFFSTGLTVAQAIKPVAFRKTGDPVADTLVRVFQEFEPLMGELRDVTKLNNQEIIKMRESMEQTMDELAKGVTEEIIEALEKVIADFNQNLTEQFGENFKRLNEACFKLVEWQENHIPMVEQANQSLEGAIEAFRQSGNQTELMLEKHTDLLASLERVGAGADGLTGAADKLDAICGQFQQRMVETEGLLRLLHEGVTNTDRAFTYAVEAFERKTREIAEATHHRSETLATFFRNKTNEVEASFAQSMGTISKNASAFVTQLSTELQAIPSIRIATENAAEQAAAAAAAAKEAADAGQASIRLTNQQMETAHKNLQDALVSLTNGFGQAYREYLEGLRKLAER